MDITLAGKLPEIRNPHRTATGRRPEPRRAPVFIQDAITPWRGETLLLALMRAQAPEDRDQP